MRKLQTTTDDVTHYNLSHTPTIAKDVLRGRRRFVKVILKNRKGELVSIITVEKNRTYSITINQEPTYGDYNLSKAKTYTNLVYALGYNKMCHGADNAVVYKY